MACWRKDIRKRGDHQMIRLRHFFLVMLNHKITTDHFYIDGHATAIRPN